MAYFEKGEETDIYHIPGLYLEDLENVPDGLISFLHRGKEILARLRKEDALTEKSVLRNQKNVVNDVIVPLHN